jgi:hypothetical protein
MALFNIESSRRTSSARQGEKGFALLVTIVLVAFLVLILVGLATFTRVETQVAANSQQLSLARQNALMCMNIAVGHLQQYAGPDKDIATARSEIISVTAPKQAYLTGVWDSTGSAITWLVSGNENSTNPTAVKPSDAILDTSGSGLTEPAAVDESYVFLVGKNSVDVTTALGQRIRLPKQPIMAPAGSVPGFSGAPTIGNFAYWVGDEGIKSSASLVDELATAGAINYDNAGDNWTTDAVKKERLNQLSPPRQRLDNIFPTLDPDLTANVVDLPKVLNRNQLAFLTGAPTPAQIKRSFHDLTPLSRGVLVDSSTGKLRRDLSGDTGTAGPVTSYQIQRPNALSGANNLVAEYFPVEPSGVAGTWPTFGIGPVVSEAGVKFYFEVTSGGNLVLNYWLDAEFWNPYAARLKTNATHELQFSVSFPDKVDFIITDNSSGGSTQSFSIPANTTLTAKLDTTLIWEPGAVRHFFGGASMKLKAASEAEATAISVSATITRADLIDIQTEVTNLEFKLELVGGTIPLQTQTLGTKFTIENSVSNIAGTPRFGYGFELNRDLLVWSEGNQGQSRDPRLPVMVGTFEETTASQWSLTPSANAGVGFGIGDLNDGARVVLFDLPRQEITALGQLRHLIGAKSYELGSSWGGGVNNNFDTTFVSTVPRNYAWNSDGSEPRPNRYLEVYRPAGVASAVIADLRNPVDSARFQLIKGAFNINSTSVDAWKAVLGSKLAGWDHLGVAAGGVLLDNAFFRAEHGAQQRDWLSGIIPPVPVSADLGTLADIDLLGATGRQLTDAEVNSLAAEIVRLIKTRGKPFLSLAAFINSGFIQQAIDNINVNRVIANASLRHSAAALTQSDIISAISPFIAARSDTFLVRAYGDVQNPATGKVEGRAWCEATVQRLPDLVSRPAASVTDVVSPPVADRQFGRRFTIISFRWLTPDDL